MLISRSIQERLYVIRGCLSRLLWPESRNGVSAALKQKPLEGHQEVLKTETVVLTNLPSLHNEVLRANLHFIRVMSNELEFEIVQKWKEYKMRWLKKTQRYSRLQQVVIAMGYNRQL